MNKYAKKVIATARAEVGYLEKASNNLLYDKTANAGNANYNKFASELDKINYNNCIKTYIIHIWNFILLFYFF